MKIKTCGRNIIIGVVTASWLSLGALTGCKPKPAVERTEQQDQSDAKLAEQVKAALQNSPSFKFPDVQINSFKGRIQLSGFVLTDDQKRSAENIAQTVPGVSNVENRISLKH